MRFSSGSEVLESFLDVSDTLLSGLKILPIRLLLGGLILRGCAPLLDDLTLKSLGCGRNDLETPAGLLLGFSSLLFALRVRWSLRTSAGVSCASNCFSMRLDKPGVSADSASRSSSLKFSFCRSSSAKLRFSAS